MSEAEVEVVECDMVGTEGTISYVEAARSSFGRLGVRQLDDGTVRIRLEPASINHARKIARGLTTEAGWKQPSFFLNRFSRVVPLGDEAVEAFNLAFGYVKKGRPLVYKPALAHVQDSLRA